MRRFAVAICSVGYIGFVPFAPGTVGSIAGCALYLFLRARVGLGVVPELTSIVLLFAIGGTLGVYAEQALGGIDPGPVVIDEVMGMLITLFLIPVGWIGLFVGFVVFRALDVVKPYPARRLERLPGGLGMMADDAMAAVYANLLMQLLHRAAPTLV